jgi:hypothetical protein
MHVSSHVDAIQIKSRMQWTYRTQSLSLLRSAIRDVVVSGLIRVILDTVIPLAACDGLSLTQIVTPPVGFTVLR